MTSASSFQMLRGSVIIFTGLLSVAFLGRKLELSQWLGILVTIVGLVVVGLADLHSSHDQKHKLSEVITGTWWLLGEVGWPREEIIPCRACVRLSGHGSATLAVPWAVPGDSASPAFSLLPSLPCPQATCSSSWRR